MLNFSQVSNQTVLGRLARAPLRLVPTNTRLVILQGPLRGWKWIVGAGSHGYWLGSYEAPTQAVISKLVRPNMTCLDVGANAGFYALMFSRLVGEQGSVHAFEPLPKNIAYIAEHIAANRCRNVQVHSVAVSDRDGEARFECHRSRSMGALDDSGSMTVRSVRLDALLEAGVISRPHIIKIDVEGAEMRVLEGARQLLVAGNLSIILATHGPVVKAQCLELLRNAGYSAQSVDGKPLEVADDFLACRG